MNAKVVIANGETEIILTPENDFEEDMIEKVQSFKDAFSIHTTFTAEKMYAAYSKHKISMSLKEIR